MNALGCGPLIEGVSNCPRIDPWAELISTTTHAPNRITNNTTAVHWNIGSPVSTASKLVPVTQVPIGNVKDHQVKAKPICLFLARMVSKSAIGNHNQIKPHMGTPYTRANALKPVAKGSSMAVIAALPREHAAVIDCPTGPNTIQSVGTRVEPDDPKWANRLQIIVIMINDATRLIPNMA